MGERLHDRVRGCLLGGAVGDALGYPVEFDRLPQIRDRCGERGVTGYITKGGRRGLVSDDTQMTLFTAEGILRAIVRFRDRGICDPVAIVDHAYARWMRTQGSEPGRHRGDFSRDGWLIAVDKLHHRRAPGNTCLDGLRSSRPGTRTEPLNNSKGCGGVMRVGPAGLIFDRGAGLDRFAFAADLAALTHGHPTGYLAAGVLAAIVDEVVARDATIGAAAATARARLMEEPGHGETLRAIDAAVGLAGRSGPPSAERVESLGGGWVAEEALAIGLYCALLAEDFAHGVLLAVNHGGDSDSTGQIAGTILGAALGAGAIPGDWVSGLELAEEIDLLASDWMTINHLAAEWPKDVVARYPGW